MVMKISLGSMLKTKGRPMRKYLKDNCNCFDTSGFYPGVVHYFSVHSDTLYRCTQNKKHAFTGRIILFIFLSPGLVPDAFINSSNTVHDLAFNRTKV